ncbi:DUF4376 domain-containing protein [Pseudomonas citronellolis]|uniref:DUF4376 domain-containing protein n=1 Tax=Pseudomonas citronellolis TaxID=53408 RepID=UPI0023E3685E|nr:DUF4376 domain-containing protein [Pseudomonas citronellolis]MDF3935348.1 DUF4376 domain-containing protein [Pseudomonas citronellolis]
MFYSRATGGFYSSDIHGDSIPADAVEISDAEYAALLAGQAAGRVIQADADGHPVLAERVITDADRRAAIAARRYLAETAGITLNGAAVPTDRESQAMVTGAALAAVLDAGYTCQWKTAVGFVTLGGEQIIAMASAMRAHVQACFDREAELLAALDSGTFTASMLDQGWPA